MNPQTLIILGMHRSGTSMVAGALVRAGAFTGNPEELLAGQDDNPLGFWERRDVVALNEGFLVAAGGSWFNPPSTPCNDASLPGKLPPNAGGERVDKVIDVLQSKAAKLLEHPLVDSPPPLLLKDPRLSLTWPLWQFSVASPTIIYVYRAPAAVARSLQRRNSFPLRLGLDLWEAYNRKSLAILNELGGVAVSFDGIQAAPEAQLKQLFSLLRERGLMLDESKAVEGFDARLPKPIDIEIDQFLTDSQRQLLEWADKELLTQPVSYQQGGLELFTHLRPIDRAVYERIGDIASSVSPLADAQETRTELERARKESRVHEEERDAALAQLAATDADYKKLTGLHEKQVAEHAELTQILENREQDFKGVARQLESETKEKQALDAALKARSKAFDQLAEAHGEEVERHRQLFSAYESLEADNRSLEADNRTLLATIEELHQKADWLYETLVAEYGRLLAYELSLSGKLHRISARGFRWLTGQRGQETTYDQALAEARVFYRDHHLPPPQLPPKKRHQVAAMARYTLANPVSSLRSLSLPRLRKVLSVVKGSNPEDLQVWVDARFPVSASLGERYTDPEAIPGDVLEFPAFEQPVVSILIPVFNEWVVTHRCLWSILRHTTIPYEVIIADDCSTDETCEIERFVSGVKVIRHAENQRFLRNCNIAAKEARGDYLVVLNNDTTVTDDWLQPMLSLFDAGNVGIVGPKLLFPDGKLQEAGGIVWDDASGWNFGRADDPLRPQYNYVRETDYVSGAALMIRTGLWLELGGFDDAFAPAYYEDTDICFQARAAGYKVLYQPASEVVHYEGLSNGTDLASGQKQYQVINQQTFRDKWSSVLTAEHLPNGEQVNHARDRSRRRRTILIIDHYVPHYDKDAGSRSTWMYIKLLLAEGYRVQFMGANFFPHEPYTRQLQQLGVEVLVGEQLARNLDRWFAENLPYVDHIFLHRPHIAEQFLPHLKKHVSRPPITFIGHDLHFLRTQREHEITGDSSLREEGERWLKRELKVIKNVDHSLYFSDVETQEVKNIAPESDVRTIPLYVLEPIKTEEVATEKSELLFVAGFNHPPNIDAAVWFVSEIYPLIQSHVGEVVLHIAGSNPSTAVRELAGATVVVHGYVSDEELASLYARADCAVVPLRFGAGVKGKVLEAIQRRVPLVTTAVGAEGIPEAERVMAIADDPEAFAQAVSDAIRGNTIEDRDREAWLGEHFSAARASAAIRSLVGDPMKEPQVSID